MALSKEIFPNSNFYSQESIQKVLKLTTIQSVGGIKCDVCKITFSTKNPYDSHYLSHCNDKASFKYTCVVCDKTYSGYPTFRDHCYMQHILKDKFKCSECGKCFPKISVLNEHVSAVHTIQCPIKSCKKKFKTKSELHRHEMVHKNNNNKPPYNCKGCQKKIHNPDDCETHIDSHYSITYFCPICNQQLNTENAKSHLTTHFADELPNKLAHHEDDTNPTAMDTPSYCSVHTSGGVRCCHCNQLFKDKMEIDLHFMEHHEDEGITYTCNICKKQFNKYSLFGDHCYFHYSKTRFQCEKCSKNFDRLTYLLSHTETCLSTSVTSHRCNMCNKKYSSDFRLQRHMRRAGHETVQMQCEHAGCTARFESQKELLLHRKSSHGGDKRFCQSCGIEFHTLQACYKHLDMHKKQQFQCPVCDHLSQDKYKMMQHVPRHFTTMYHACNICGKIYEERRRLMQHTKTHDNEKNHKCQYCGKSFVKSNHLQQHVYMHTGMTPYKCVACPKTFASYPNWNKHLRKIHNIDAKTITRPEINIDQANQPLPTKESTKLTDLDKSGEKVKVLNSLVTKMTKSTDYEGFSDEDNNEPTKNKKSSDFDKRVEVINDKVNRPKAFLTKNINSSDVNKFSDDSMDSESEVENEIDAIEKSLADSIDNAMDIANVQREINTTSVEIHHKTNNYAAKNNIGRIINNNNSTTYYGFDDNLKNATPNTEILITHRDTDHTTYDFDERARNNEKNEDIAIAMELQEPLNEDDQDEMEAEMLEEFLATGVLPATPQKVVPVNVPQTEYGPDFINADSPHPLASPGELIHLDDHLLPHIDPLLTIKCQEGPDYTNLTNLTNLTNPTNLTSLTDLTNFDQYENGQMNEMNYQTDAAFPNPLYLYDQNDLSNKTDIAQPNLNWGPTSIFTGYV